MLCVSRKVIKVKKFGNGIGRREAPRVCCGRNKAGRNKMRVIKLFDRRRRRRQKLLAADVNGDGKKRTNHTLLPLHSRGSRCIYVSEYICVYACLSFVCVCTRARATLLRIFRFMVHENSGVFSACVAHSERAPRSLAVCFRIKRATELMHANYVSRMLMGNYSLRILCIRIKRNYVDDTKTNNQIRKAFLLFPTLNRNLE